MTKLLRGLLANKYNRNFSDIQLRSRTSHSCIGVVWWICIYDVAIPRASALICKSDMPTYVWDFHVAYAMECIADVYASKRSTKFLKTLLEYGARPSKKSVTRSQNALQTLSESKDALGRHPRPQKDNFFLAGTPMEEPTDPLKPLPRRIQN